MTQQDLSFDDDGTRMYLIETAKNATTFIYVYKLSSNPLIQLQQRL